MIGERGENIGHGASASVLSEKIDAGERNSKQLWAVYLLLGVQQKKRKKKRLALVYTEIDKGQGGEEEWEAMSRNPICGTSRCSGNLCGTAKVNSARGKKQQNCNPVCKDLHEGGKRMNSCRAKGRSEQTVLYTE